MQAPPAPEPGSAAETRYRAIVEDQPDLVCRFRADGILTFANDAYCAYFGVEREAVIGRPYQPIVHPDDAPVVRALVESLSPSNPVVFIENRVFRADGEVRWTEWSNRALYDDDGRLEEFQAAGRDVTDRKRGEEVAARLAAIVASADVAIYSTTLDGVITSWNRAAERMFGYTAAEAIGHSISLLIPADVGVEGLDIPNRVRRGETIERIEMEKLTKSGQRVPISLTVSPIVDAHGQVIGISRIAGDITERRRTEAARDAAMQRESEARAAAEAASRMKDEFLAVVSHELRTPLNAILGWAHMLRGGAVAADAVPKAIDTIERNARIQAQLVEDLLDVSRIISGKMALKMAPVDLPSVVRAAIDAVRPAAAQKDIEVRRTMQQDIVVAGDAARLQQAVWNLLVNAIKFTPARGRVEVDVQRIDRRAVLTVRDTGVGIDPAALPFIFDRFRQADRGTTRAYGGLGLGLTIVDYVAQAHGGTVRAESAGPGRGATFELTLPLRAGAAAAAPARTAPERPDLAGRRVLVVDDDPDARDLARAILEPCGAAVETAASVGDALTAVRHAAPDLLIGDIAMPDQDGFDLIRLIRSAWPGRTIPALALTAYSGAQHRDATLAAGYDAHLGKPIDPDVLCAMVAQLTRQTPES